MAIGPRQQRLGHPLLAGRRRHEQIVQQPDGFQGEGAEQGIEVGKSQHLSRLALGHEEHRLPGGAALQQEGFGGLGPGRQPVERPVFHEQGGDPGNVPGGGLEDPHGAFPAGSWLTQISRSVAKPSPRARSTRASTFSLGGWGVRERIQRYWRL